METGERLRITGVWASAKIVVLLAAAVGVLRSQGAIEWPGYLNAWNQWDTRWFESIATQGYFNPYLDAGETFRYNVAFFPGFPATMAAGDWLGLSPVLAGLIVAAVASLFTAFAIARLTQDAGGQGQWGVVALLVAPTALFLTAAYTEALFCALAFWAWIFARRNAWWWAGLLAAGAAVVRANALFLMAGMVVLFLLTHPWRKGLRGVSSGLPLLLPLVSVLGYFAFLRVTTGSWTAWHFAEVEWWNRHLVDPFTSLATTVNLVFTYNPTGGLSTRMMAELAAMAIMVGFVVILLGKRWWAEAVYVGATAAALGTSTMYYSVPRALVVLFPIWMILGLWLTRKRWLRWVYAPVGGLSLIIVTVQFTQGQWIS